MREIRRRSFDEYGNPIPHHISIKGDLPEEVYKHFKYDSKKIYDVLDVVWNPNTSIFNYIVIDPCNQSKTKIIQEFHCFHLELFSEKE